MAKMRYGGGVEGVGICAVGEGRERIAEEHGPAATSIPHTRPHHNPTIAPLRLYRATPRQLHRHSTITNS